MNEIDRVEAEYEDAMNMEMSSRGKEWTYFADDVLNHIEEYTVPQYGDYPDDQLTTFSIEEIGAQLKRYNSRIDSNSRGFEEAARDCLKIAHYACVLRSKIIELHANKTTESEDSEVEYSNKNIDELWEAINEIRENLAKVFMPASEINKNPKKDVKNDLFKDIKWNIKK